MASSTAIKRGDLILTSKPFAHALLNDFRGQVCDHCFAKNGNLKKCTECSFAYYCDKNCQKFAWKDHKQECSNLKRIRPSSPDAFVRLLARIVYKLKRNPDESEKVGSEMYRFNDLMGHDAEVKKDLRRKIEFGKIETELRSFIPHDEYPSMTELFEIYGKIVINKFEIIRGDEDMLGIGLYLGPSKFNHFCKPNAVQVFDGPEMRVIALEDISQLKTSKIFISYVHLLTTTKERQIQLKTEYYFSCKCVRCQDLEKDLIAKSIKCPNKNCEHPTIIKKDSFDCLGCGEVKFDENKRKDVEILNAKCQSALIEMEQMRKFKRFRKINEIAQVCIQEIKPTFHSLNIVYVRILDRAIYAGGILEMYDSAMQLAKEKLIASRYYCGNFHPSIGFGLVFIGSCLYLSQKFTESHSTLVEALDIISKIYPKNNFVYSACTKKIDNCQFFLKYIYHR